MPGFGWIFCSFQHFIYRSFLYLLYSILSFYWLILSQCILLWFLFWLQFSNIWCDLWIKRLTACLIEQCGAENKHTYKRMVSPPLGGSRSFLPGWVMPMSLLHLPLPSAWPFGGYCSLQVHISHITTEEKDVNFSMEQTLSLAFNMCENNYGSHVNPLPAALPESQLPALGL